MPDLTVAVPLIVSALSLLGIGSLLGQWVAGAKDRRAARADVLAKLGAVEVARWWIDGPEADGPRLVAAIRALETSALLARVPRSAVIPYAQLSMAALWEMQHDVESRGDPEFVGLASSISDVVTDAAAIVSRAAWSTPATRWLWLGRALNANAHAADAITDRGFKSSLKQARRNVR